jgi:rhodanese-related sulfurtransferase
MKQFLEFVQHHWMLWVGLAVVLVLIVIEEIRSKISGCPRISPQEVTALMNHQDAVVVDLRSQQAFAGGHILGSINIPQAELSANMQKLDSRKDKDIILVDSTDVSLAAIGKKLQQQGFSKIYFLRGGFGSWKEAGLPLTKK